MTIQNDEIPAPLGDGDGDGDGDNSKQPDKDDNSKQNGDNSEEEELVGTEQATLTDGGEVDQHKNSENDAEEQKEEENDWRGKKIKHWKDSPFAVGCVNINWKDDRPCCGTGRIPSEINQSIWPSAYVCGCLGAGRVGNLAVLAQTMEDCNEAEMVDGTLRRRRKRPKLLWVVGPYWPVNLCVTHPLILGISFWTGYTKVIDQNLGVIITWSICTGTLIFSLIMVACSDPGVLYRHTRVPEDAVDWRWNDQARTYRPAKARFDPECQVVVDGFDHVCPWTGTAIGAKNMFWFKTFVTMVPICIAYTVVLHILL